MKRHVNHTLGVFGISRNPALDTQAPRLRPQQAGFQFAERQIVICAATLESSALQIAKLNHLNHPSASGAEGCVGDVLADGGEEFPATFAFRVAGFLKGGFGRVGGVAC